VVERSEDLMDLLHLRRDRPGDLLDSLQHGEGHRAGDVTELGTEFRTGDVKVPAK